MNETPGETLKDYGKPSVRFVGSSWSRKKNAVVGNLVTVTFVIATLIGIFMVFVYFFN